MAPMMHLVSVIIVLVCPTLTLAKDVHDADATVGQLVDTLREVLQSLEDDQQKVKDFSASRQQWCEATLRNISEATEADASSITSLQIALKENEVALEETKGSVQQVEADIDLTKHTIKQSQEMRQVLLEIMRDKTLKSPEDKQKLAKKDQYLNKMLDDKKKVLASLQEERQVVLPLLAQLQAKVAEGQRRISGQNESSTADDSFVQALRVDCSEHSRRAAKETAVSNMESQLVQKSLQALKKIRQVSQPQAVNQAFSEPVQPDMDISFLQQKTSEDLTEADVLNIFGGSSQDGFLSDSHSMRRSLPPAVPWRAPRRKAAPPHRSIKMLLAQLSAKGFDQNHQNEWCETERRSNAQDQQRAKVAATQLAAEVSENAQLETQLANELLRVQRGTSVLKVALSDIANASSTEHSLLRNRVKQQQLASKVVAQAIAIIADIEQDHKVASKIVEPLKSAKKALDNQAQVAKTAQQELVHAALAMVSKARQVLKVREQQSLDLQELHERYLAQALQSHESQQSYDAEEAEAASYAQKLAEVCSAGDRTQQVQQQRQVEIHALEDAQNVLAGNTISNPSDTRRLRGLAAPAPKHAMTALERAAAAMGVDVDSGGDSES